MSGMTNASLAPYQAVTFAAIDTLEWTIKNHPKIVKNADRGLKIAAWGLICGIALTYYSLHQAYQSSTTINSRKPLASAMLRAPLTFACGAAAGAILKGAPLTAGAKFIAKAPLLIAKYTIQYGSRALIQGIRMPFSTARWLLT